jgi:hypothetical protein
MNRYYSDNELISLYPNHSLKDLKFYQATHTLEALKGNKQTSDGTNKLVPMFEPRFKDYHSSNWPGYIGHI